MVIQREEERVGSIDGFFFLVNSISTNSAYFDVLYGGLNLVLLAHRTTEEIISSSALAVVLARAHADKGLLRLLE